MRRCSGWSACGTLLAVTCDRELSIAIGNYDRHQALGDGRVRPEGLQLHFAASRTRENLLANAQASGLRCGRDVTVVVGDRWKRRSRATLPGSSSGWRPAPSPTAPPNARL